MSGNKRDSRFFYLFRLEFTFICNERWLFALFKFEFILIQWTLLNSQLVLFLCSIYSTFANSIAESASFYGTDARGWASYLIGEI